MVLMNPWVVLAIIAVGAVAWRWRRKLPFFKRSPARRVAHSERIRALPSYKAAFARYRRSVMTVAILLGLTLFISTILAARPSAESVSSPAQVNRDIMLCLDVSGSMDKYNKQLLQDMQQLISSFRGQRVGLVIFNSAPVTVFPLTDDYDLIQEQIKHIVTEANQNKLKDDLLINATYVGQNSSEIGLGILSCVNKLGSNLAHRSQSIILATDNEAMPGTSIQSSRSLVLAKQKGIRVYALDPGISDDVVTYSGGAMSDDYQGSHGMLRTYSIATGGGYYGIRDPSTIPNVVTQVFRQEAKLTNTAPTLVLTDAPIWWLVALILCAGLSFVLIERYKLW